MVANARADTTSVIPDMWVIYKHPRDFPNSYVARRWINGRACLGFMVGPDLEQLRAHLPDGLMNIGRMPGDDPAIFEVWI